jgi:hypothetical protein
MHHERGKNAGMAQPGQDVGLAAARLHQPRTVSPAPNPSGNPTGAILRLSGASPGLGHNGRASVIPWLRRPPVRPSAFA